MCDILSTKCWLRKTTHKSAGELFNQEIKWKERKNAENNIEEGFLLLPPPSLSLSLSPISFSAVVVASPLLNFSTHTLSTLFAIVINWQKFIGRYFRPNLKDTTQFSSSHKTWQSTTSAFGCDYKIVLLFACPCASVCRLLLTAIKRKSTSIGELRHLSIYSHGA